MYVTLGLNLTYKINMVRIGLFFSGKQIDYILSRHSVFSVVSSVCSFRAKQYACHFHHDSCSEYRIGANVGDIYLDRRVKYYYSLFVF